MKWLAYLLFAAGIAAIVALVGYYGYADVAAALATAAWGVVLVVAFHLVPLAADTIAWRYLLPPDRRARLADLLWMRWVSESVNNLLPATQIGGDLVRGRLAAQRGVPAADAAASIVADITTSVFTLIAFGAIGALLLPQARQGALLLAGLAISAALVALFGYLQHRGLFAPLARRVGSTIGGTWDGIKGSAAALDAAVARIYARRGDVAKSCAWAFAAWVLGAGEVFIALHFLGSPIGILDAIAIESLIQALRSAAFPVPGALGVQEGGFVLLGAAFGLAPETALALSLVKRVREVVLGLPGLIVWQIAEGRHLVRKRALKRSV
ncbi:MAG TPA: lysylphosphatidylglycerol synthase domain-containing protein [Burkholderiales bacterium]|nr:lysylphosphatidylglycerol synthase domain-containing protein [Burkholderiales bacterium]